MKKLLEFSLLFLCNLTVFAQNNIVVKYTTYMRLDVPLKRSSELVINNSQSIYKVDYNSDAIWKTNSKKDTIFQFLDISDTYFKRELPIGYKYYFNDLNKDSLYIYDWISNRSFKVKDIKPNFKWLITNESKVINDLNCLLAKTNFRGRDYDVWFAPEIALPYGPWKFSGLPGLIIEVIDSKGEYYIKADEIIFNAKIDELFKFPKTETEIELKKFVELFDELYFPDRTQFGDMEVQSLELILDFFLAITSIIIPFLFKTKIKILQSPLSSKKSNSCVTYSFS